MEDTIMNYLTLYIPITLFIIDTIGNSIIVAILTRDKFRQNNKICKITKAIFQKSVCLLKL